MTIFRNLLPAVCCLTCLTLLSSGVYAALYKQVDKDGNVTYTDIPDKTNTKPIKPPPIMTFTPPAEQTRPREVDINVGNEGKNLEALEMESKTSSAVNYQSLSISSPENGTAVRANGGVFTVQVNIDPALDTKNQHRVVILMDGQKKAEGQSTSFTVADVGRGEHTLSAQIVSGEGDILLSANNVTIQVLRHFITPSN